MKVRTDDLNQEQAQCVQNLSGHLVCLAGAGTGKTKTLVRRFDALQAAGVPLKRILCMTFTTEAADEMAKRAGLSSDQTTFRTFHSLGFQIVLAEKEHLHFPLSDDPVQPKMRVRLLFRLTRKYGIEQYKDLDFYISHQKRNGVEPRAALQEAETDYSEALARAYAEYDRTMRDEGWLDFDSMLIESLHLLETNAGVRKRWQMHAIQVDETQDTDDLQFKIVQKLSEEHKNVFMVGDPNQAIYEWRGAHPKNMLEAEKWFPGSRYIYLIRNYRSTKTIVDYARKHAPIKNEQTEGMLSARGVEGVAIEYKRFLDSESEAKSAIFKALEDPDNSAILGRTNRLLATVENLCADAGKRYKLLGKSGFWHQEEVKHVMSYAQFICDHGSDVSLRKVIVSPFRPTQGLGISKSDLLKYLKDAKEGEPDTSMFSLLADARVGGDNVRRLVRLLSEMRSLRTQNAAEAMECIIATIDAANHYEDDEGEDNFALENINSLVKMAKKYNTLTDFVDHARKCFHTSRVKKGAITLSTIHQAKGKEWLNVIVLGVSEGMLPHKKGNEEEEARIFYVAITRPADLLRLTYCDAPSRYIADEIPRDVLSDEQRRLVAEKVTQVPLFDFGATR